MRKKPTVHWLQAAVPGFWELPEPTLDALLKRLRAETFAPQQCILREGDSGDTLYLVAEGQAEVTMDSPSGPLILAVLGPQESFGEIAVLSPERRRTATVTALTPMRCFTLAGAHVQDVLTRNPAAKAALQAAANFSAMASLLKQATPFAALHGEHLRSLVSRLIPHTIPAGTPIVRQGEAGNSCYLLRHGRAEVVLANPPQVIATVEAGMLFGEAALLTTSPRNATVRAVEACEVLELRRDDLLAVMGTDRIVHARMMDLLRLHSRPTRRHGIIIQHQRSADGTPLTVLNEPERHAYFRLSAHGWFLWQLLDGRHNLRDLTLAFLGEFRLFAPHVVAEIIAGLSAGGFLEAAPFVRELEHLLNRHPWTVRIWRAVERILNWRTMIAHADPFVTRWYHRSVQIFFRRASQWLLALLAVTGFVAFCVHTPQILGVIHAHSTWWLWLAPILIISILLHEAGHAFTVKACGREVLGLGIGLHWGMPILFVDTSDMWMATRWPRIAVSLAGPYTNCIVGSSAALIGWALASPIGWMTAAASYMIVLINLSPLWELDGYYALCDYFERPDLSLRRLLRREERRVAARYLLCVMGYVLLLGVIFWSL